MPLASVPLSGRRGLPDLPDFLALAPNPAVEAASDGGAAADAPAGQAGAAPATSAADSRPSAAPPAAGESGLLFLDDDEEAG